MKKETTTTEETTTKTRPRVLSGVVLSSNMKDTIVVAVTRYVKHPKYKKYMKRVKRYKVHDAGNTCKEGDKVRIEDGKPISKDKSYRVIA
jgi:small subunit ribosomal protein S17